MVIRFNLKDLTGGELTQRLEVSFVCHFSIRANRWVGVVIVKKEKEGGRQKERW